LCNVLKEYICNLSSRSLVPQMQHTELFKWRGLWILKVVSESGRRFK